MKIAAVTLVRNDSHFLLKWIAHYGAQIGTDNLYVVIRGADWPVPALPPEVSRIVVTDSPASRGARNAWSARYISDLVAFLLQSHDAVIRADTDEFITVDPASDQSLPEVIAQHRALGCMSALGTDVIQNLSLEPPLDPKRPILGQRRHGIVTREFSKPCIVTHPVRWGAGYHRADGQEVRFAPDLHLFHLALHDRDIAEARLAERSGSATSQSLLNHVTHRLDRFAEVDGVTPLDGDQVYAVARAQIAGPRGKGRLRTRPGFIIEGNNVERGYLIRIPDRFAQAL